MTNIIRRNTLVFLLVPFLAVLWSPWAGRGEEPVPLLSWTSKDGRVIQASFVKLDGAAVVIAMEGRQFAVPLENLAPESVELAKKLAATPSLPAPVAGEPDTTVKQLMLADGWDKGLAKGDVSISNFKHVLTEAKVEAKVDLTQEEVVLFPGIKYFDPAAQAQKYLIDVMKARSLSSRNRIAVAGFPGRSLSSYDFSGDFDGFGHFILIVDASDQVVAVQLIQNTPKSVMLNEHSPQWLVYNFVQGRRKAKSDYAIGYSAKSVGGVIEIKSELVDSQRQSREWVRLLMAPKFAAVAKFVVDQY